MRKFISRGFGTVEALLIILIVAIFGFGGYYVWHTRHKTTVPTPVVVAKQGATTAQSPPSTTPKAYTSQDAVNLVQTTYNTYVASEKQPSGSGALDTIKNDLSNDLYQSLKTRIAGGVDSDLIVCSQAIPDKVTANLASTTLSNPSVYVIEVLETFGTDTSEHPFVTVDLTTHKITSITCSHD